MSARRLRVAFQMTARMLLRSRLVLLLLFVVPSLFYAIVDLTTPESPIAFQLASLGGESDRAAWVTVGQRQESPVFIGLAAVGLLTAFLALNLIQKEAEVNRHLVLCGYRPAELVIALLVYAARTRRR